MVASVLLAMVALYGILSYTVPGRTPGDSHQFVWYSCAHGEFVREMFMNALLYMPLGATLGGVVGLWSVPVGLALSAGVEAKARELLGYDPDWGFNRGIKAAIE